ncbi:VOC family protein [Curvivirga sp.]|uniref:VOC family protein n=1 Tax=Curvivirga sp. TaxID=2856848 RepID=UPI003B5BC981
MIGYTSLGTNDLSRAALFYDELLKLLDGKRMMEMDDFIVWSDMNTTSPGFSVHLPVDGKPASIGNGVMIALSASNPALVDTVYQKAIELGAKDEGKPGPRGDTGFYAAYFRDLDGNKLNVHYLP